MVLEEVEHTKGEYLAPIFIVPKKDGEYRMILNLKELNENIVYHHFKMDTFESALKLVKKNCFFASADLRHAYYSVPLANEIRKKFCFQKSGKVYQYMFTKWDLLYHSSIHKIDETRLCFTSHAWTYQFWLHR